MVFAIMEQKYLCTRRSFVQETVVSFFHTTPPSIRKDPTRFIHRAQEAQPKNLVTSPPGVGDNTLELVDLGLSTTECTESLLCQLACALVLAVTEEFDDTTLIWCESASITVKSACALHA